MVAAALAQLRDEEPDIPAAGEHVWNLFWDLNRQRAVSSVGMQPINAQLIESHCRLMRFPIQPWEFSAILDMDSFAYWKHQNDKANPEKPVMKPATPENVRDVFKRLSKKR